MAKGRCGSLTSKGGKCKNRVSKGKCYLHSFSEKTPVEAFHDLEGQVWKESFKGTCQDVLEIIKKYMTYIRSSKEYKWLSEEIRKAGELSSKRVYDYEPGTGRGSKQFYKFAKAIESGKLGCKDISLDALKVLIRTYVFDQIE